MENYKVIQVADLGPVIARADFHNRTIELNGKIFPNLPPMVQEYVMCHEVCHLRYDDHDEAATTLRAQQLFLARANGHADLAERKHFLSTTITQQQYGNEIAVGLILLIAGAITLTATTVGGIISLVKARNIGWYSWNDAVQRQNLAVMLDEAFSSAKEGADKPASDYFWLQLDQYTAKDDSLEQFLGRKSNLWVNDVIPQYEAKWGFGFTEVYEKKIYDHLWFKALMAVAVAAIVYLVVERVRK